MLSSTPGCFSRNSFAIARTSSGVMCRRSARGWTVMPGDPAAIQTSTASRTLGTLPPREFRSVATLFTFTDSLTIARRAEDVQSILHHGGHGGQEGQDLFKRHFRSASPVSSVVES